MLLACLFFCLAAERKKSYLYLPQDVGKGPPTMSLKQGLEAVGLLLGIMLSIDVTSHIPAANREMNAAVAVQAKAEYEFHESTTLARACDTRFEQTSRHAHDMKTNLNKTQVAWKLNVGATQDRVDTCEMSLKGYLDRNKKLEADLIEAQLEVEHKEAEQLRNALRSRAVKALTTLSMVDGGGQKQAPDPSHYAAMSNTDLRNTMVVVVEEHVTDGTSVPQLQALTFGGLVRKAEQTIFMLGQGTGGVDCDDDGGEAAVPVLKDLRQLLQEMREEGGESFEGVSAMCGADVRNSLITELWSRTKVAVDGLQALSDQDLLVRGRDLLRQGVLPQGN
jgi:hypothetical protein